MRAALLCAYSAEELFKIRNSGKSAELVGAKPLHLLTQTALPLKSPTGAFIATQTRIFQICLFTGGFGTNSLSQNLTVLPAPSEREPLALPETLRFSQKLSRHAKGPISEGAVCAADWGSFPGKGDSSKVSYDPQGF